jgi:DNA-binding LacI/PurR family transcriptional regulator
MGGYKVDPTDPLPRYYQIYTSLIERVRSGEFTVGNSLPAERQLAEDYGVSRITVIKALGRLEREGLITRQHGRGTFITKLAQQPQVESVQLKRKSIAFLVDVLPEPFALHVLAGIAHEAARQRYYLQVITMYGTSSGEAQSINEAIKHGVEGLIIFPYAGYQNAPLYQSLCERGFPVVMADRYYPQIATDRVIFDDAAASFALTEHLIRRGHRRIAIVPFCEIEATSVRARVRGYQRALEAHDLPYDEDLLWLDVYPPPKSSLERAFDLPSRRGYLRERIERDAPTALLAVNYDAAMSLSYDLMAINNDRMRDAIARGEGQGDIEYQLEFAAVSHKSLDGFTPYHCATAVQSGEELGTEAAKLLIGRLSGAIIGEPHCIVVPMRIETPVVEDDRVTR